MTKLQILENALKIARDEHATAVTNVTSAKTALKTATDTEAAAETKLSTAKTALTAAETALAAGATATVTLVDLQKAVDVASAVVATATTELATAKTSTDTARTAVAKAETELTTAKVKVVDIEKAVNDEKASLATPAPRPTPPAPPANVTNTVTGGNSGWLGLIAGLLVAALILLAIIAFGTWRWSAGDNTPVQTVAVTAPAPAPTIEEISESPPQPVVAQGAVVDPTTLAVAGSDVNWYAANQEEPDRSFWTRADGVTVIFMETIIEDSCWKADDANEMVSCAVRKADKAPFLASCGDGPRGTKRATATCPEVVITSSAPLTRG